MRPDLKILEELVRQIAREELMPRFNNAHWQYKPDGSIVSEADLAVQHRFVDELQLLYPAATLLGEEMEEDVQRELASRQDEYLWCLDPLDGTNNFAVGFPYFCISLALLKGSQPIAGIVYDPNRDECFSALYAEGAWLNARRLRVEPVKVPLNRCVAMIDFKRLPKPLARGMADRAPVGSWRYTGAGALEWCWLAAGRFHAYLHGRQKLWDFAAGALIFAEAGGIAESLEGEPLYAPGILSRSVVAAPDAVFFAEWRKAIAEREQG